MKHLSHLETVVLVRGCSYTPMKSLSLNHSSSQEFERLVYPYPRRVLDKWSDLSKATQLRAGINKSPVLILFHDASTLV